MAEFPCPHPVTVSARLAAGSVDLVAEDRDTALVTVEPYDSSDDGREAADETRVELRGDTLVVRAPETGSRWGRRNSARLRFDIRVPTGSSIDVRTASAEVTCHGSYHQANVDTASGDSFVEHVAGDVAIDTASGVVRLGAIDGNVRVKAASGDTSARYVGGDARVNSASGAIEIDEANASVRAESASGTVRLGVVRRGAVRVETVSGAASVGVAAGTGVWLDLRTLSGSTSSDLNVGGQAPPTGHDLELQVHTVSGDIDVHRVAVEAPVSRDEEATQ